jgi:hypothetical protein
MREVKVLTARLGSAAHDQQRLKEVEGDTALPLQFFASLIQTVQYSVSHRHSKQCRSVS